MTRKKIVAGFPKGEKNTPFTDAWNRRKRDSWEGWMRPGLKLNDELFYHRGHMWDVESLKELVDHLDKLEDGIDYLRQMKNHKSG